MATLLPGAPARAHTFDGLAHEIVEYAITHAQTVTARRGESITHQGEAALRIFVIRDGFAKMVSTSEDGHDVLVGIVGPRDVFGHATMSDQPRDYLVTSTALCPMTAAVWSRDKALVIAEQFPEVHKRIDAQVTRNLEAMLGRLHTVSEGRVSQRLARALLELGERHGQPGALGVLIVPPMTRRDIASIVGTTLFTASRLLSEWEDRGLIASSRARVRLRSLEGLRLLATEAAGL
jgi:CRP/FNR family transcriptional regulator, nitrogen oxide reductase regulator